MFIRHVKFLHNDMFAKIIISALKKKKKSNVNISILIFFSIQIIIHNATFKHSSI